MGPLMAAALPSIIGAVGSIGSAVMGSSGQAYANRVNAQNYQLSREDAYQMQRLQMDYNTEEARAQRDWANQTWQNTAAFDREMYEDQKRYNTEMANTEIQRRVKDLQAAGLNPMLAAAGQGASSPGVHPPTVNGPSSAAASAGGGSVAHAHEARNPRACYGQAFASAINAYSALNVAKKQEAEIDNIREQTNTQKAQTRKVSAEASLTEADVPYAAKNAETKMLRIDREFQVLGITLEKEIINRDIAKIDFNELKPLVVQYQKLVNQAEKLGIPEKEATAKMFENVPFMKWVEILRRVIPSINIGKFK